MSAIELEVLDACQEAELRRKQLLPHLAAALAVEPEEVFYHWALRRCPQHGTLADPEWGYFFHGLECDLKNKTDGRFLRFDFGPGGTIDTATAWGVLQFVMTTCAPWSEFRDLKERFAQTGPPYDQFSGDIAKFYEVWEQLEQQGCFETAAPQLVAWEAQHTSFGEDGIRHVRLPDDTPERVRLDCSVAHRKWLSAQGRGLLEKQQAAQLVDGQ